MEECHFIVENMFTFEEQYQDYKYSDQEDSIDTLYSIVRLLMLAAMRIASPMILAQRAAGTHVIYPSREARESLSFSHLPDGRVGPYDLVPAPDRQEIRLTVVDGWVSSLDNIREIHTRLDDLETGLGAPLLVTSGSTFLSPRSLSLVLC